MLDFKFENKQLNDNEAFVEANRCISCDLCLASNFCPSKVDIKSFISAIKSQDLKSSINTIKINNNITSVSCLLCGGECEAGCILEKPIKVQKLESFVENRTRLSLSLDNDLRGLFVAVIGAGPTGLTAALELAKKGASVTVYDENKLRGGIFSNLIANYNVTNFHVEKVLTELEGYSAKILENVRVDSKKMNELLNFFNYVLICTGKSKTVPLKTSSNEPVKTIPAREVLSKINYDLLKTNEVSFFLEGKTLVVGDNLTTIEVARAVLRLGSKNVLLVVPSSLKNNSNLLLAINEGLEVEYDAKIDSVISVSNFYNVKFNSGLFYECNTLINGYLTRDLSPFSNLHLGLDDDKIKVFYDYMSTNEKVFAAGLITKDSSKIMDSVNEGNNLAKCVQKNYLKIRQ